MAKVKKLEDLRKALDSLDAQGGDLVLVARDMKNGGGYLRMTGAEIVFVRHEGGDTYSEDLGQANSDEKNKKPRKVALVLYQ